MVIEERLREHEGTIVLDIDESCRSYRLREMYWDRTHERAMVRKPVVGSGEDTLIGHARDFAALLDASDPLVQPDELIVGCCLAIPEDRGSIDLGYYNTHYPP